MKFPVLTYTILRDFENCPHLCFHRHVGKTTKFVKTEAMELGTKVHETIEQHLKKGLSLWVDDLPPVARSMLHKAVPLLCKLTSMPYNVPVRVEYFIGVKINGEPCQWDAQDVWLRLKADVAVLATPGCWLIDWKTGNKREDEFELECQAMVVKAHHPDLISFVGEYFWFKEDFPYGVRYTLDPAKTLQKVHQIYGNMVQHWNAGLADGVAWPKKKNPLCKWCDVYSCENNTNPKGKLNAKTVQQRNPCEA
jgi:hypothetical protein